MKMIKTDKLIFEYAKRDEEGNIIGKSRAVDEVDLGPHWDAALSEIEVFAARAADLL